MYLLRIAFIFICIFFFFFKYSCIPFQIVFVFYLLTQTVLNFSNSFIKSSTYFFFCIKWTCRNILISWDGWKEIRPENVQTRFQVSRVQCLSHISNGITKWVFLYNVKDFYFLLFILFFKNKYDVLSILLCLWLCIFQFNGSDQNLVYIDTRRKVSIPFELNLRGPRLLNSNLTNIHNWTIPTIIYSTTATAMYSYNDYIL